MIPSDDSDSSQSRVLLFLLILLIASFVGGNLFLASAAASNTTGNDTTSSIYTLNQSDIESANITASNNTQRTNTTSRTVTNQSDSSNVYQASNTTTTTSNSTSNSTTKNTTRTPTSTEQDRTNKTSPTQHADPITNPKVQKVILEPIHAESPPERKQQAKESQQDLLNWIQQTDGITTISRFWIVNAVGVKYNPEKVTATEIKAQDNVTKVIDPPRLKPPEPPTSDDGDSSNLTTESTITNSDTDISYGLNQTDVRKAWDKFNVKGENVHVFVTDDNIDPDHEQISLIDDGPNYENGYFIPTDRYENGSLIQTYPLSRMLTGEEIADEYASPPVGPSKHGTHVSATLAGDNTEKKVGVAPNASVSHADIFKGGDAGIFDTQSHLITAIERAAEENADIVSISLGNNVSSGYYGVYSRAIQNAHHSGTLVVVGAGNEGNGETTIPGVSYNALTVGATTPQQEVWSGSGGEVINHPEQFENESDRRVNTTGYPASYVTPDIVAPGENILSAESGTTDEYMRMTGTSMATPHVSGVAALMLSNNPSLTPNEIKTAMAKTAAPVNGVSTTEKNTRSGHGLIDADDALAATNPGGFIGALNLSSPQRIDQGDSLYINTTLKNENVLGENVESTVTLYRNETAVNTTTVSLASEETTHISYNRTPPEDMGAVKYRLDTGYEDATNTTDIVIPAKTNITSNLTVTNPQEIGQNITANIPIKNVGDIDGSTNVSLKFNGTTVNTTQTSVTTTEVTTVTLSHVVTDSDYPTVNVTIVTNDDSESENITITPNSDSGVSIDNVGLSPDSVAAGNNITVTTTLNNTAITDRTPTVNITTNEAIVDTQTPTVTSNSNTQISTDIKTAASDVGELPIAVTIGNSTTQTTATVTEPTPPSISATTVTEDTSADEVTISGTVTPGSLPVNQTELKLASDEIPYTNTTTNTTALTSPTTVEATFETNTLPIGGTYTGTITVEDTNQTQTAADAGSVTVDITDPHLKLSTTNTAGPSGTLEISSNEQYTIDSLSVTTHSGTDRTPSDSQIPDGIQEGITTVPLDTTVTGSETTLNTTVTISDASNNTKTDRINTTLSEYELSNGNGTVTPSQSVEIAIDANTSAVADGMKDAGISQSNAEPAGTSLDANKRAGTYLDVDSVSLTDAEIDTATIRIDADTVLSNIDDNVAASNMQFYKSDDGEQNYSSVTTTYNETANEFVTDVGGFSQFAVAIADTGPPKITNTDVSPSIPLDDTTKRATVTFEHEDELSSIDVANTTTSVGVASDRVTKSVTQSQTTVTVAELSSDESVDVDITVADTAGNTQTATETITFESDSTNDNTDDNSGGGGGGGGGGAGGTGGGQTPSEPASLSDVKSTLSLATPENSEDITVSESNADKGTYQATPTKSSTVNEIVFETQTNPNQITVTDYGTPPQTITEKVTESATAEVDPDDAGISDAQTQALKDGQINVLRLSTIESQSDLGDDSTATVSLSVDKSAVTNPSHLVVLKESYVFEEQRERWVAKETTIESTTGDTITISTTVDSFSLFTVTEIEGETTSTPATNTTSNTTDQSTDDSNDSIPGFGGITAIIAVLTAIAFMNRC